MPTKFSRGEAAQGLHGKTLAPTSLDSAALKEAWSASKRRRSFFSATCEQARLLAKFRTLAEKMLDGEIDLATARHDVREYMPSIGFAEFNPDGVITDFTSIARRDLILKTQQELGASAQRLREQTPEVVAAFPAWRFVRKNEAALVKDPRDWLTRWHRAGEACDWKGAVRANNEGEMVALKDSPIWLELGTGAGGYTDTLDNPFPPFAYNSGFGWLAVGAEECARLGLEVPKKQNIPDGNTALDPAKKEVDEVVKKYGKDFFRDFFKEVGL